MDGSKGTAVTASLASFQGFYSGKRVLVTGHTGFKGSWLCEWLLALGAEVHGFALAPDTTPALFEQLSLATRMNHRLGDVRNADEVQAAFHEVQPEVVFHLAAQPLVRVSYETPAETFATNVMGTVNCAEALRLIQNPSVAVFITTDKCYDNKEWLHSYRECDPMGGKDPYSASKGCAELVVQSYRHAFLSPASPANTGIATARAGNVIGGGDWALDRLIPDCVRSLERGKPIPIRNAGATRPWQHVLDPLSGYLTLGQRIGLAMEGRPQDPDLDALCAPFNFGPALYANRSVARVVEEFLEIWPGAWKEMSEPNAPHEALALNVASDKAFHILGWRQVWPFETAIRKTAEWYLASKSSPLPTERASLTQKQIMDYTSAATDLEMPWASS